MKIWLLQIGESLPIETGIRKLRTAMLADKLIERGHYVLWWASSFDHFRKEWAIENEREIVLENGVRIMALRGTGYKKNVAFSRLFDHRIVARKFRNRAPNLPLPNIIVASMPTYDLAYEGLKFAKVRGIPIIVDIRDQWPDLFIDNIHPLFRTLGRIALHRDFQMLKETMRNADSLLSMMNTLLEWGLKYAGRGQTWKDRVFYLGYQKPISSTDIPKKILPLIDRLRNRFTVTFIGTFASYHNPSVLVEAAKHLQNKNICFVLAGDGELASEIRQSCSGLNNVLLPGWLNQDEANFLLLHSHVGVCPTPKKAFFFPNKAFQYLAQGLPVISSFQGDFKKIIQERHIGFYYDPNDIPSLIASIEKLQHDPKVYDTMARNALTAFEELFDANKIYNEYAAHIEAIAKSSEG